MALQYGAQQIPGNSQTADPMITTFFRKVHRVQALSTFK